jgi:hypothetical protein
VADPGVNYCGESYDSWKSWISDMSSIAILLQINNNMGIKSLQTMHNVRQVQIKLAETEFTYVNSEVLSLQRLLYVDLKNVAAMAI